MVFAVITDQLINTRLRRSWLASESGLPVSEGLSEMAPSLASQLLRRVRFYQLVCGVRPDTKWLISLNPGVDACPGVTSESMNASSSAVIFTACALV